jgi:hypothetical protein
MARAKKIETPVVEQAEELVVETQVVEPVVEPQVEEQAVEQAVEEIEFTLFQSLEAFIKPVIKTVTRQKLGIGKRAQELIMANPTFTNKQIVELIMKEMPSAQTNANCISWYRNDLKKKQVKLDMAKAQLAA